jgi:uncharacterized membrane protein (UPF0136 family)
MKSQWLDAVVVAYAILLVASGIHGFLDHNMVALITRCVSGAVVLGLAAYGKTNPRVGRIGIAVLALVIMGHTAVEYLKRHGTTSLILAVASLVVFACLLSGHFLAMRKLKAGVSKQ